MCELFDIKDNCYVFCFDNPYFITVWKMTTYGREYIGIAETKKGAVYLAQKDYRNEVKRK